MNDLVPPLAQPVVPPTAGTPPAAAEQVDETLAESPEEGALWAEVCAEFAAQLAEHSADSMVMQTIIVSKDVAKNARAAKRIARGIAGGDPGAVDETGSSYRYRQRNPGDFDHNTFRTKQLRKGVSIVVGKLKHKASALEALADAVLVPVRCPGMVIKLAATPTPMAETWNQIAKRGKFDGHGAGPFEFNDETFDELIANFERNPNRRVPVDYEHTSETMAGGVSKDGAPALAWVTKLETRDNGETLWGLFEWVDQQAIGYVRAGKYLYLSPAINFTSRDPVSGDDIGARLSSVALTNDPFLQGMQPLAASQQASTQTTTNAPAPAPTTQTMGLDVGAVHVPVPIGSEERTSSANATPTPRTNMAEDNDLMKSHEALKAAHEQLKAQHAELAEHHTALNKHHMALHKMLVDGGHLDPAHEAGEVKTFEEIEKLVKGLIDSHKSMKADVEARMAADAKADVEAAMPEATTEAKAAAMKMRLNDPAGFKALFPAKAPPAQLSAKDQAVVALLAARVAGPGGAAPSPVGSELPANLPDPLDPSQITERAERLMKASPTLLHRDACIAASAELKIERDKAMGNLLLAYGAQH